MTTRGCTARPGRRTWTGAVRERAVRRAAAGQAAAGQAAGLRRVLDLRLRGRDPGRAGLHHRQRRGPDAEGPQWYHVSSVGHFVNSVHLWSVELFFVFMVVHLWGKFWMAAWRGRRAMTWITGVVSFLASIGTAFTGYLVQTNFDSQWISSRGQGRPQLRRHRRLVQRPRPRPDAALARRACCRWSSGAIVVWHVLLVRRHGVVPPLDAREETSP